MANPPFSEDVLKTRYSAADPGGADGDHQTTVPFNFDLLRTEVLDLHTRLGAVEGAAGISTETTAFLKGEVNGHFQVARFGPDWMTQFDDAAVTTKSVNRSAFLAASSYSGMAVAAGGSANYTYIPTLFPGWFMAQEFFTNIGERVTAGEPLSGAKFTIAQSAAHFYDATEITPGSGDLPGVYQVLTRHIPIEALRGRALTLRVRYGHTAATESGLTVRVYIAYVDSGGNRVTATSPALVTTSGSPDGLTSITFGTAQDATAFPNSVLPADCTSVEVGIAATSHPGSPGLSGDDEWTLASFLVDVGGLRGSTSSPPYTNDLADTGRFYAQMLATERTGVDHGTGHPLLDLFQNSPAPTGLIWESQYPWGLWTPWRSCVTALVPDCRLTEVIGATADSAAAGASGLSDATDAWAIMVANPRATVVATEPFDVRGVATHLRRDVTAQVTDEASGLLQNIDMTKLDWAGEIACGISPVNF